MLNRLIKPEIRYARRMARIARWDRPLEGAWDRLRAWTNMLFVDHGIFRLIYLNRHRVGSKLWRTAQPAPHDIEALARREGLKSIVTLRGGREYGSWPLEKEACDRHGVALLDFVVRSRAAPERDAILDSERFFAELPYPALVHCKSGADRAGFFSALYLLVHEKRPLDEALKQLSWRYGHFRWSKTGILDAFFERYRREGLAKGVPFMDWVRDIYDPQALERDFKPGFWSSILVDRLLDRE